MATKKSLDDMRDEAYRRQDNLASDIDELIDRVHPKNAVTRWKNELLGSVKSFSEAGDGKTPAAVIAGGVIGVILIGTGIAVAIALSGRDDSRDEAQQQAAKQEARAKQEKARAKEKARAAKAKARAAKD